MERAATPAGPTSSLSPLHHIHRRRKEGEDRALLLVSGGEIRGPLYTTREKEREKEEEERDEMRAQKDRRPLSPSLLLSPFHTFLCFTRNHRREELNF